MTATRTLVSMTAALLSIAAALLSTAAAAQPEPAQRQPWPAQTQPGAPMQAQPGAPAQPWPAQAQPWQPGAAPPQGYFVPQGAPSGPIYIALPRTLPYRERQEPPQGFRLETRPNRGMAIAGVSVLGGAWAISALIGGTVVSEGGRDADAYWPLLIPVAGPFVTLGTSDDVSFDDDDERFGGTLMLLDGLTQVTGLALLVGGLVSETKIWVRSDIPQQAELQMPEILVGPTGGAVRFRF